MFWATVLFLILAPSVARAESSIVLIVKRGFGFLLWFACLGSPILGIYLIKAGLFKLGDASHDAERKNGRSRVIWGIVLTVAPFLAVAIKIYLTHGISLSPKDVWGQ